MGYLKHVKCSTSVKELPKTCMFFGYGSLMYAKGINGRGMRHIYTDDELIPYKISGLRRSMSAEVSVLGSKARFYSVYPVNDDQVFGMLFKMYTYNDLIALLTSEKAQPVYKKGVYKLCDITDYCDKNNNLRIFTLICKELKDNPAIYYPGYVSKVYNSIPVEFRNVFVQTGGVYPDKVNKNSFVSIPMYSIMCFFRRFRIITEKLNKLIKT